MNTLMFVDKLGIYCSACIHAYEHTIHMCSCYKAARTMLWIHVLCPFQLSRDNVQKFLQLKFCDIVTIVAKVSTNPSMEQKGLNLSAGVK